MVSVNGSAKREKSEVVLRLTKWPALGWVLYAVLALSAGAAFAAMARPALVPQGVRSVVPFVFIAFLVLFALYRFELVRAGRFAAGRAFLQVGVGVLFSVLLLLARPPLAANEGRPFERLLRHSDPEVRAFACDVARYLPEGRGAAKLLVARLRDSNPQVRAKAKSSLVALAGRDLSVDVGGGQAAGSQESPASLDAWERWAETMAGEHPTR